MALERLPGRKVRVGKNIYPDFDDLGWKEVLKRFGIEVNFLLDDGVVLSYPENLEPFECPGDVSFYDTRDKTRVLTWCENFGTIQIFGPGEDDRDENIIAEIKILDGFQEDDKSME